MQQIEAPTEEDIDSIAQAIVHAQHVTTEVLGAELDGTRGDLTLIQRLLDTGTIERESTYTLQALGLAFGRAFVHENKAFDWWIVEDGCVREVLASVAGYGPLEEQMRSRAARANAIRRRKKRLRSMTARTEWSRMMAAMSS